ncbi:PEP-utilizing enzyme [Pseudonocardia sp. GCM10023141]|uniref:PEP-utilizing enzyme n=1 Tax=Pseudonocardia sp. GCM10023141 TaxID=3252653 RepID=UPI003613BD23
MAEALSLTAYQEQLDDEMCTWPTVPTLFTRANAVDQWPRPLTPLTQDLIAVPQERGLDRAFADELGTAPKSEPWTWNGVFYGWFTYGVTPAADMADNLPGYSRAAVYADYFGVTEDPDAPAQKAAGGSILAVAGVGKNFVSVMRNYPKRATAFTAQAREQLAKDLATDWATEPDGVLAARLRGHCAEHIAMRAPHVEASVISAPLFQNVSDAVRKLDPENGPALVTEALSGLGGIHLREATRAMGAVARGEMTREAFLDEYGFRGTNEFELAAHPWREDPATLDRLIAAAGAARVDATVERRDAARARIKKLAGWRWALLGKVFGMLETHMRWRENGKVPAAMATHSMRLISREAGRRLAERGRISDADDIWFLRLDELVGELSQRPAAEVQESVKRRRRTHELAADLPLPEMLDVRPGLVEEIGAARWKAMGVLPPAPPAADGGLSGVGGSPGAVTGRARIVDDPNAVEIEEGDVLVARGTDSAWTPLFFQAAAVVVDVGGPMSHSAIAAREVGIPCVVNVKTGTTRIREGQSITVDGSAGTVTLH